MNALALYLREDRRLSLCRGLVGAWVTPRVVAELGLPVKHLRPGSPLVELDVDKLKQARDVSPN